MFEFMYARIKTQMWSTTGAHSFVVRVFPNLLLILIMIVQNMRSKQSVKHISLKMSTMSTALLLLCSSVPLVDAAATCSLNSGLPCTFGGCTFDTDDAGGSR